MKDSTTPTNKRNLLTKAAAGTARQFRKPGQGASKRPQMALPYQDASWWVLVKLDSVLVSAADGTSAAWYQRDPKMFRSLGLRSLRAHRRLRRQWPRLAAEYRAAAAEFTSPAAWRQTFAASTGQPAPGPAPLPARHRPARHLQPGPRHAVGTVSRVPTRRGGRTSPPAPADGPRGTGTGRGAGTAARYAPALAAALVMAVLGVWGLGRDSAMGNDEVATRYAALLPLHLLARLLRHVDAVHGLYYLLMHGWMAVGTSPAVMRIPSVIAMTAAAALVAIIGRRLTGSGWAALFAGLIMAFTPTISYYAQTARSYALVYACVAGATLVLLHALSAEQAAGTAGPVPGRGGRCGALGGLRRAGHPGRRT